MKTKRCHRCKKIKPVCEFYSDRSIKKDGYSFYCKKCKRKDFKIYYQKNKKRIGIYSKEAYKKQRLNPEYKEKERLTHLRKGIEKYGITLTEYDRMVADQKEVCFLCGKPELIRRLSIDHNHKTGKVRGLLCTGCNIKLEWFINLRENIVSYL